MSRSRRIGIEISPEGVRAVLVEGRRGRWVLRGQAGRNLAARGGVAEALAETVAELGASAPCRILLLGSRATSHHLRFPPMPRRDLLRAVAWRLGEPRNGEGENLLEAVEIVRRRREGVVDLRVVRLPREPLESWTGLLETLGCPVEGVIVPAALAACSRDAGESELMVLPAGGRLCLVLAGGRGEVVVREGSRRHPGRSDPVSVIERRLDDINQLQEMIAGLDAPPRRVVVCGGSAEVEPTVEQLRMALAAEGVSVEVEDPWQGLAAAAGDAEPRSEMTGALLAALGEKAAPLLVPGPVERRRQRQRAEGRTLAVAGLAAVLFLAAGLALGAYRTRLEARVTTLGAQLAEHAAPPAAVPGEVRPAPPATEWSALLREVGLLVRPGIDYETLVVDLSARPPRLALEGDVRGGDLVQVGQLLGGLHEDLFASPFVQGLPRLAVAVDGRGRARFALEDDVTAHPRED